MERGVPIKHSMVTRAIDRAQKAIENKNFKLRWNTYLRDEVINKLRTQLFEIRQQTLADTHPCLGRHHGPSRVEIPHTDEHFICQQCLEHDPEAKHHFLLPIRPFAQSVLYFGVKDCFKEAAIQDVLVEQYATAGDIREWNWKGILKDLGLVLGRKVALKEICKAPSRMQMEKKATLPFVSGIFGNLFLAKENERQQLVNPKNQETPWLEREVLRRRLGQLISDKRIMDRIDSWSQELGAYTEDRALTFYAALYRYLMSFSPDDMVSRVLGTIDGFKGQVKTEADMEQFLKDRVVPHLKRHSFFVVGEDKRDDVFKALYLYLKPFEVRWSELTSSEAFRKWSPYDSYETIGNWCLQRIGHQYRTWIKKYGKSLFYRWENEVLREVVDAQIVEYLAEEGSLSIVGSYDTLDEYHREIQVQVARLNRRTRGRIAHQFARKLAQHLKKNIQSSDQGKKTSYELSRLPDGLDKCACGSGREFAICCGMDFMVGYDEDHSV